MRRSALPIVLLLTTTAAVLAGHASDAEVNGILDEIKLLPPARRMAGGDPVFQAGKLPPFSAAALAAYRADDYKALDELLKRHKANPMKFAKEHPVRAAVLNAADALQKSDRAKMREALKSPIDAKQKAAFLKEQSEPGILIFELEQALSDLVQVAESDLEKEKSKRWRANFDYTVARLKARIVFIYEYSYLLGQIRSDNLPELNGATGWKMVPRAKITVTEPKAKTYAKEVSKAWTNIQKEYPDTPWAVLASRESTVQLGLEWRTNKE